MSEDSPYNHVHVGNPYSHLPADRQFKPKISSVITPYIPPGSQINVPQNRHDHDGQAVHRDPGLVSDPFRDVKSSSQSHPPPLQQAQRVPAALVDNLAKHGFLCVVILLNHERQLEQILEELSLYPRTADQQGHVGGQYPFVLAQNDLNPMYDGSTQQQRRPRQQYYGRGEVAQAVPLVHPQQKVFSQQQQQPIHQPQQVLSPQNQQGQPLNCSTQLRPGTHNLYGPATRNYSRDVDHQQKHGGGSHASSEASHLGTATPKPLDLDRRSMEYAPTAVLQAVVDQQQADSSTFDSSQEQPEVSKRGLSGESVWQQPSFSPSRTSATPVRLSEVAADSAYEMLPRKSLGPDISSSVESDGWATLNTDVNVSNSSTIGMPPVPRAAMSVFAGVRGDLEQLHADIGDLSDGSDSSPESSGSDSETLILSEQRNDHTTNNVREETGAPSDGPQNFRTNTEEMTSVFNGPSAHKRSNLDGDTEDRARAAIAVSRKRNKLSSSRFICCFHNGPGRKCSGTDDSISEVVKRLSEQHDTRVCDRCWVLKVKDKSSGRFVHPNDNQACLDHCLSPQCHKSSSTIGHRHLFDQNTCGTKTSRVRPGDSEAVYRFIFRLVHPGLDCPASVLTTEHSLHLDAVPRQSRRKLNRKELAARANDLERRLEIGEQENAVNALRITHLEQELAEVHLATARAEEKNAQLEKQTRRIVAMLSDALRTGVFLNSQDHQSLLRRVEEDAPGALVHQSQSLLTPSASDRSRNSSATPVRVDMAEPDPFSQPAAREGSNYAAPLQAIPGNHTTDGNMSDLWANEPNMDRTWDDIFDEPGESDITSSQPHRSDPW